MNSKVFEDYIKKNIDVPFFIKLKNNKIYLNNEQFFYEHIKYVNDILENLNNKKNKLLKNFYDLYYDIHYSKKNITENQYDSLVNNIKVVNNNINDVEKYYIDINKIYDFDTTSLQTQFDINNARPFNLDRYDKSIEIQKNILEIKNSKLNKIHNIILSSHKKDDEKILNINMNIKDVVKNLNNLEKLKSSNKEQCSSLKRSEVTFMSLQELAKLIMKTPELLSLMPPTWRTMKKSEICGILFPSEDEEEDEDKESDIEDTIKELYEKGILKSNTKDECSTLKRKDASFMKIQDLVKLILTTPALLKLMPSNWKTFNKEQICEVLFPEKKEDLNKTIVLKAKNAEECGTLKKSSTTFMKFEDLVKLILMTPSLLKLMPANWKKLNKKQICDVLFPEDKPKIIFEKGETSGIKQDIVIKKIDETSKRKEKVNEDKDVKIVNITEPIANNINDVAITLYNEGILKSNNKEGCSTLKKSDTRFMKFEELIKVILNNPELLRLMPEGWKKMNKGQICSILFPN
jgi:hypothetical protein